MKYKFKYSSKAIHILSNIAMFMQELIVIAIPAFIIALVFFSKHIEIASCCEALIVFVYLMYRRICCYVIINNNTIKIFNHCYEKFGIGKWYLPYTAIEINSIKKCYIDFPKNITNFSYAQFNKKYCGAIPRGKYNDLCAIIELQSENCIIIPLENQEKFVNEVREKMEMCNISAKRAKTDKQPCKFWSVYNE